MRELSVNNYHIKLYDSVDELPIVNFQKYNKYILLDSGLGSDIDSVDEHLANLAKLIKTDKAKASQELQNLRLTLHFIVSNISPKYMAFAALIHSINGERVEDLSDANLKAIIEKLQAVKRSKLVDLLLSLKKKLNAELNIYFPTTFGSNAKEKDVYDKLKRRVLYKLDGIINDNDNAEQIQKIDDWLFSLYKPRSFVGAGSVEVEYDKHFERCCVCISQETHQDAKRMTVLEFYTALDEIKRQAEAKLKAYKKIS